MDGYRGYRCFGGLLEELAGVRGFMASVEGEIWVFEEGAAWAWGSGDFDAMPDRPSCGEDVGPDSSAGRVNVLRS